VARPMRKVLVIYGSPREGGNTDILLEEIVRGIKEKNKNMEIEKVYLRKLCIYPCKECRACDKTGKCIIEDDMQKLHAKFLEADWIILGSPIFFYSVTANVKAMIDRCQALWARKYLLREHPGEKPKEKRGGWFVCVGATRRKKLFEGASLTVKYFFDTTGVPYRGELLVRGIDKKGEMLNHPDVLSRAYSLGKNIASLS